MMDFLEALFEMLKDPVGIMSILVGGLMIVFAIFAVEAKKIVDSLIALSAISLLSVLLFVVLKAPDVAITEAAVGSGLVTAVMIFALWRVDSNIGSKGNHDEESGKAGEK